MFYLIAFIIWIALAFFLEWLDKPRQEHNRIEIESASTYELKEESGKFFLDWDIQDMIHEELMKRSKEKRRRMLDEN